MIQITEALSYFTNGRRRKNYGLKNISILDLPAFGSKLSYLSKTHTNSPNWPMEVNFAILNKYKYNNTELSTAFRTYKELIQLWAAYMDHILKDETSQSKTEFQPDIADFPLNPFNFTEYILDDLSTFLQVYMHSHPTVTENQNFNLMWQKAAERVFDATLDNEIVHVNGLFDNLFLDCSYKGQFMKAGEPLDGNCDLFQRSLTSNALCYSFNTETPSNIWSDSFSIAKVIEDMGDIKTRKKLNFAGAGASEGKFNHIVVIVQYSCLQYDPL